MCTIANGKANIACARMWDKGEQDNKETKTTDKSRVLLRKLEPVLDRNRFLHPRQLKELTPLQILQPNRSTVRDPTPQDGL